MIVCVHSSSYVCVVSDDKSTGFPSHQSTVYAFAKYLFICIVLPSSVAVASISISIGFGVAHFANDGPLAFNLGAENTTASPSSV